MGAYLELYGKTILMAQYRKKILFYSNLLSVTCLSVKEFLAIFLLQLAQSSSISPRSFEGFTRTLKQSFNWIRQQMKNFPIDPHCKNWPLSATL